MRISRRKIRIGQEIQDLFEFENICKCLETTNECIGCCYKCVNATNISITPSFIVKARHFSANIPRKESLITYR